MSGNSYNMYSHYQNDEGKGMMANLNFMSQGTSHNPSTSLQLASPHHGNVNRGLWMTADHNRLQNNPVYLKSSDDGKILSSIAKMPIFPDEENVNKRNFKPELLAEALAAKSNLGLIDPLLNSSALGALQSYGSSEKSPLHSSDGKSWPQSPYESEKYGYSSSSTDKNFSLQKNESQRQFNEDAENHSIRRSNQNRSPETAVRPLTNIVLNSVDEEDLYLYGDSSTPPTPIKSSKKGAPNIAGICENVKDSGWSDEDDAFNFDPPMSTGICQNEKYAIKNIQSARNTNERNCSMHSSCEEKSKNITSSSENANKSTLRNSDFKDQVSISKSYDASPMESKSKYHAAADILKKHITRKNAEEVSKETLAMKELYEVWNEEIESERNIAINENKPTNSKSLKSVDSSKESIQKLLLKELDKNALDKKSVLTSKYKKLTPLVRSGMSEKSNPINENYCSPKSHSERTLKQSLPERRRERSKEQQLHPRSYRSRSRSPRCNLREKSPKYRSPDRYHSSRHGSSHYTSRHHLPSSKSHKSPDRDHRRRERSPPYRSDNRSPRRRSKSPGKKSRDRSPRHTYQRSSRYYERSPRRHSRSPCKPHRKNSSTTSSEGESSVLLSDERRSNTPTWSSKEKSVEGSFHGKGESFERKSDGFNSLKDETRKSRNELNSKYKYSPTNPTEVISDNIKATAVDQIQNQKIQGKSGEIKEQNLPTIDIEVQPLHHIINAKSSTTPEKTMGKEQVDQLLNFIRIVQKKKMLDELSETVDSINASPQRILPENIMTPEPPPAINALPPQLPMQPIPELIPMAHSHCVPQPLYSQPYSYPSPVVQNISSYSPADNFTYPTFPLPVSHPEPYAYAQTVQPLTSITTTIPFYGSDKSKTKAPKKSSNRVCSLKSIPIKQRNLVEAKKTASVNIVNVNVDKCSPEEIVKETIDKSPPEKKIKTSVINDKRIEFKKKVSMLLQKNRIDKNIKDETSTCIESYKKLSQERDLIQKKLRNMSNAIIELKDLRERLEKKSRLSKSPQDKQVLSHATALFETSNVELTHLIQEGKRVDTHLKQVKEKIAPEVLQKLDDETEVSAKEAKISEVDVKFTCFDSGNHWCQLCYMQLDNILMLLEHLHHNRHKQNIDPLDQPWATKVTKIEKTAKNEVNCHLLPLKGTEFIIPFSGFYCSLCKESLLDKTLAEQHLKSHEHTVKYMNYIKENPIYEQKRDLLKEIGLLDMQKENKRKSLEAQRNEKNAKRRRMEAEANKLRNMLLEQEKKEKLEELEEINSCAEEAQNNKKSTNIKLNLAAKEKPKSNDFKKVLKEAESKRKPTVVLIGRAPNYKPRPKFVKKDDLPEKAIKVIGKSETENKSTNIDQCAGNKEVSHVKPSPNDAALSSSASDSEKLNLIGASIPINNNSLSVMSSTSKTVTKENKVKTSGCQNESETKTVNVSSNKKSIPVGQAEMKTSPNKNSLKPKCKDSNIKCETKKVAHKPDVAKSKDIKLSEIELPKYPKKSSEITKQKKIETLGTKYKPELSKLNQKYDNGGKSEKVPISRAQVTSSKKMTEEEKDLAMLGISKDDLMPMAVPKPPPNIQNNFEKSNNLSSSAHLTPVSCPNENVTSSMPVTTFQKPLPPFPPPLQVPPPNVVLKSNANTVLVNTAITLQSQNEQFLSTGKRNLITIVPSKNLPTSFHTQKSSVSDLKMELAEAMGSSSENAKNSAIDEDTKTEKVLSDFKVEPEVNCPQPVVVIQHKERNFIESEIENLKLTEDDISCVTSTGKVEKDLKTYSNSGKSLKPEKLICEKALSEISAMNDSISLEQHSSSQSVSSSGIAEAIDNIAISQATSNAILSDLNVKPSSDKNEISQCSFECDQESISIDENSKYVQENSVSANLESNLVENLVENPGISYIASLPDSVTTCSAVLQEDINNSSFMNNHSLTNISVQKSGENEALSNACFEDKICVIQIESEINCSQHIQVIQDVKKVFTESEIEVSKLTEEASSCVTSIGKVEKDLKTYSDSVNSLQLEKPTSGMAPSQIYAENDSISLVQHSPSQNISSIEIPEAISGIAVVPQLTSNAVLSNLNVKPSNVKNEIAQCSFECDQESTNIDENSKSLQENSVSAHLESNLGVGEKKGLSFNTSLPDSVTTCSTSLECDMNKILCIDHHSVANNSVQEIHETSLNNYSENQIESEVICPQIELVQDVKKVFIESKNEGNALTEKAVLCATSTAEVEKDFNTHSNSGNCFQPEKLTCENALCEISIENDSISLQQHSLDKNIASSGIAEGISDTLVSQATSNAILSNLNVKCNTDKNEISPHTFECDQESLSNEENSKSLLGKSVSDDLESKLIVEERKGLSFNASLPDSVTTCSTSLECNMNKVLCIDNHSAASKSVQEINVNVALPKNYPEEEIVGVTSSSETVENSAICQNKDNIEFEHETTADSSINVSELMEEFEGNKVSDSLEKILDIPVQDSDNVNLNVSLHSSVAPKITCQNLENSRNRISFIEDCIKVESSSTPEVPFPSISTGEVTDKDKIESKCSEELYLTTESDPKSGNQKINIKSDAEGSSVDSPSGFLMQRIDKTVEENFFGDKQNLQKCNDESDVLSCSLQDIESKDNTSYAGVIEYTPDLVTKTGFKELHPEKVAMQNELPKCEERKSSEIKDITDSLNVSRVAEENRDNDLKELLISFYKYKSGLLPQVKDSNQDWKNLENLEMHISALSSLKKCDTDMGLKGTLEDLPLVSETSAVNKVETEGHVAGSSLEESKENSHVSSKPFLKDNEASSCKGRPEQSNADFTARNDSINKPEMITDADFTARNDSINKPEMITDADFTARNDSINKPEMMTTDEDHESDTDEYINEDPLT